MRARNLTLILLAALLLGYGVAQQESAKAKPAESAAKATVPFLEHPAELRHAYAIDLVGLHLDTLELGVLAKDADDGIGEAEAEAAAEEEAGEAEGDEDEGEEEEEGLLVTALPLMAGSLGEQDDALMNRLETALIAIEIGDTAAIGEVRGLLTQIEEVLIPAELSSDPDFGAARLALLALLEPGVGEGYEESANGEVDAYIIGYAGLQRIEEEWANLKPELKADPSLEPNIERAFNVLNELMPSPELPEHFSDPEDAETAVNDIVFGLEGMTGATLIPRDFAALLDAIGSHIDKGCQAYQAGNTALALEWAFAADFFYNAYLSDAVGVLAADADERIDEELGEFIENPASDQTPNRCENLNAAIKEASSIFGG